MRRIAVIVGAALLAIGVAGAVSLQSTVLQPFEGEVTFLIDDCVNVGKDFDCHFSIGSDSSAMFPLFRWDFDGDGVWDHPVQSSPNAFDLFVFERAASRLFTAHGLYPVCVQGWDAGTFLQQGEEFLPQGPIACHNLVVGGEVSLLPTRINSKSQGQFVNVVFRLPSGVDGDPVEPATVTLAGLPAVQATRLPGGDTGNNPDWSFKFDRGQVISTLGKGTHKVILKGIWDDGKFFSTVTVTIT